MLTQSLREFHEKFGFLLDVELKRNPDRGEQEIYMLASDLANFAKNILQEALANQRAGDPRLYRVHLIAEELSEVLKALAGGRVIDLADGIGDLLYVTAGTSETFGLPTDAIFTEVHRSNMSKMVPLTEEDRRMRNKGPDYSPPNMLKVIWENTPLTSKCCNSFLVPSGDYPAGKWTLVCSKCYKDSI